MANPQAEDTTGVVSQLLTLKHPARPGSGKVPLPLRKFLPDPLYETGWAMLTHDVSAFTPTQRQARAFRLRVAIAQCEPDDVPDWAIAHLVVLEAA